MEFSHYNEYVVESTLCNRWGLRDKALAEIRTSLRAGAEVEGCLSNDALS